MYTQELISIGCYFLLLLAIGYFSYQKHMSATGFIIGNRSMNCWLTALAAHASDMSSWLVMAYPAAVFSKGVISAWTAIGLTTCMYLNWRIIAPKIRVATEKFNSMTFSSFFESRFKDTSGRIRVFSAIVLIVFYTIYISAGLTTLGDNLEVLFQLKYSIGVLIGLVVVIPYVFSGGYLTLAWIDLFQGLFLMCVIIFIPLYMIPKIGGWGAISENITINHLTSRLIPDFSQATIVSIISLTFGWGLGYFGQPHIVTKFMGIKKVSDIPTSKWIGMTWMVLSLGAATLIGLVGIAFFKGHLDNPELVLVEMVKLSFSPIILGLVLCAIIATTINAMSSQILVLSSSLAEDLYKKLWRKHASSREVLLVSRLGIILVACVAFLIAFRKTNTIYQLVLYAWSGIGSAFGPLVILSLYYKKANKYGAWAGILIGGSVSAVWPLFNHLFPIGPLIPGFFASMLSILWVSHLTRHKLSHML
ncbi:MAG: sodium/proline symporter [Rhabdochlamydiaceae bacterium]|jgi:sodium/proline symporter